MVFSVLLQQLLRRTEVQGRWLLLLLLFRCHFRCGRCEKGGQPLVRPPLVLRYLLRGGHSPCRWWPPGNPAAPATADTAAARSKEGPCMPLLEELRMGSC